MSYLAVLQFVGIILFSSITREIFAYKQLLSLSEIVNQRVEDMNIFLYAIDCRVKTKSLPQDIVEMCGKNITQSIENSTSHYFEDNKFF